VPARHPVTDCLRVWLSHFGDALHIMCNQILKYILGTWCSYKMHLLCGPWAHCPSLDRALTLAKQLRRRPPAHLRFETGVASVHCTRTGAGRTCCRQGSTTAARHRAQLNLWHREGTPTIRRCVTCGRNARTSAWYDGVSVVSLCRFMA
jgi:hypothetical protein